MQAGHAVLVRQGKTDRGDLIAKPIEGHMLDQQAIAGGLGFKRNYANPALAGIEGKLTKGRANIPQDLARLDRIDPVQGLRLIDKKRIGGPGHMPTT